MRDIPAMRTLRPSKSVSSLLLSCMRMRMRARTMLDHRRFRIRETFESALCGWREFPPVFLLSESKMENCVYVCPNCKCDIPSSTLKRKADGILEDHQYALSPLASKRRECWLITAMSSLAIWVMAVLKRLSGSLALRLHRRYQAREKMGRRCRCRYSGFRQEWNTLTASITNRVYWASSRQIRKTPHDKRIEDNRRACRKLSEELSESSYHELVRSEWVFTAHSQPAGWMKNYSTAVKYPF